MSERDELAKVMFRADNWRMTSEEVDAEWDYEIASGRESYCHVMADAAIAAGFRKQVTG